MESAAPLTGIKAAAYMLAGLAAIALVGSVGYALRSYFRDFLRKFKQIPLVIYEGIFYIISLGFLIGGLRLGKENQSLICFIGCLFLLAAISFTIRVRKLKERARFGSSLLAVVLLPTAWAYNSNIVGFFAVLALFFALFFSPFAEKLCDLSHSEEDQPQDRFDRLAYKANRLVDTAFGRATTCGFLILGLFVAIRFMIKGIPNLSCYDMSSLGIGAFSGYAGLLILSSKRYDAKLPRYLLFWMISISAALIALDIGQSWQIVELSKVGGTFTCLFIFTKFFDIPAQTKRQWALVTAAASLYVISICLGIINHQEWFSPYLFFV